MRATIINGAVHGSQGNTAHYLKLAAALLAKQGVEARIIHLADHGTQAQEEAVRRTLDADLVLLGSGTYWDTWGSPLQRYLEELTAHELSDGILGKPAGVLVTMDSVGGSSIVYRLQGALSSMGFLIPPVSAMVLSRVGAMVRHPGSHIEPGFEAADDVWCEDDIAVVVSNLIAAKTSTAWTRWPIASNAAPMWPKQ